MGEVGNAISANEDWATMWDVSDLSADEVAVINDWRDKNAVANNAEQTTASQSALSLDLL